jgi:hypothetical protein
MQRTDGQALRKSSALLFVVAAHLLLLFVLIGSHISLRKTSTAEEIVTLVLPMSEKQSAKVLPQTEGANSAPPPKHRGHENVKKPVPSPSAAIEPDTISAPNSNNSSGKIDPQLEIQKSLELMLPSLVKAQEIRCAEAERNHARRPFGCQQRYYDKHFWEPSGNLLKDMRDPERPRSSAPDPLPPAFGRAPRPEAFKPE